MKRMLLVFASVTALLVNSCKEVGPQISLKNNENAVSDTTYIESPVANPQIKNVLIEEFTGVKCPNCPQGHVIIANLKQNNPDRISAVSYHPFNSLGLPYSFSQLDFRTQTAQTLFDYLGQIGLEPAAGVDRTVHSGETHILLDKNKWTGYVNQQLTESTPVNIELFSSYDSVSRELTAVVELHYTNNVTEDNKLSLLVTESDLTSAQLDGAAIDTFYVHNDIMRTFISDIQGDLISVPKDAGRVVRKVYKKPLEDAWDPHHMHLVAFVHEFANRKNVYQSREIKVF